MIHLAAYIHRMYVRYPGGAAVRFRPPSNSIGRRTMIFTTAFFFGSPGSRRNRVGKSAQNSLFDRCPTCPRFDRNFILVAQINIIIITHFGRTLLKRIIDAVVWSHHDYSAVTPTAFILYGRLNPSPWPLSRRRRRW